MVNRRDIVEHLFRLRSSLERKRAHEDAERPTQDFAIYLIWWFGRHRVRVQKENSEFSSVYLGNITDERESGKAKIFPQVMREEENLSSSTSNAGGL